MPKPPAIRTSTLRVLYALLFLYIGIAATYEIVASISAIISYFNLRNQVVEPFRIEGNSVIADPADNANRAGLSAGDTVLYLSPGKSCDLATAGKETAAVSYNARPVLLGASGAGEMRSNVIFCRQPGKLYSIWDFAFEPNPGLRSETWATRRRITIADNRPATAAMSA